MKVQLTKQQLESNIRKLYWINALNSTGFLLVVYTLFILSKGFTMQQFFLIESAYMIVALLSEIPTGMFSDRISRKWSLALTSIIGIPTTFFIIISNNFWIVLVCMAIGGLASSFTSGTDVAMMYDSVKALKKEKDFKKINGKMKWYGAWAGAIGGIIAGFLASYSLSYPWWASWIIGFPIFFIILTLIEPPITRKSVLNESQQFHLSESFKHSFSRESGFFVIYSSSIWLFLSLSFWLWQPYLKLTGLPLLYFGFFYAIEGLISGYASKQAHKIEPKIGMSKSLLFAPIILSLCFILQSQFVFILGFLFIFIHSISGGYLIPVMEDYINKRIPSERRATILSIKNMMSSLLFAIVSPFLGYLIDAYSLQTALLLMAGVLLVVTIILYVVFRKINNQNKGYLKSQ